MNIGKAIRQLRKDKNLSQKELADLIEISQNSLSQIEIGSKRPNPQTMKRICKVLNTSESMLYILSVEEKDVPAERKQMFDLLYPDIKSLALKIFSGAE
jgi:transcriptional regulator with XRE-family HTH domain